VALANDIDIQLAESRMWLLRKDPTKALDVVKVLRQQQPENPSVIQAYYAALGEAKDFRTLLADSDATLKVRPDIWWLYQYRAIARKRGNSDRTGALNELKAGLAVATKNNDAGAITALIRTMGAEVGPDEARKALAPLAEKEVQWQILMVSLLQDAGQMKEALELDEKILATPNLPARNEEQALKLAGILYLAQTPPDFAKAVAVYRKLLELLPNDSMAMNNLASLLVEEGTSTYNPQQAVEYAQKVYDMSVRQGVKEELPLIMDTLAWAMIQSGRLDEGISLLRSAMEKKPFVDGHYHLGRAYMKKQPPDLLEAQRALDSAWQLIQDAEREGRYPDPTMRGKVEKARAELRQKR